MQILLRLLEARVGRQLETRLALLRRYSPLQHLHQLFSEHILSLGSSGKLLDKTLLLALQDENFSVQSVVLFLQLVELLALLPEALVLLNNCDVSFTFALSHRSDAAGEL